MQTRLLRGRIIGAVAAATLSGCSAVTANLLSDDTIKKDTAGVIGVQPEDITIANQQTEGGTTYYTATTKSGIVYACSLEGGNVLTFGLHNPPVCKKKGT